MKRILLLIVILAFALVSAGEKEEEKHQVDPKTCIGCTLCVQTCPVKAIAMTAEKKALIDPEKCVNCGLCATKCPVKAIHGPTAAPKPAAPAPAPAAPAAEKKTK